MTRSGVIGVFDSGVGGLTVLKEIHDKLPHLSTAYLGDTARVPYGTRSADTVVRYALGAARFLRAREELSVLVIACNTASAVAIEAVSEQMDVPVIGVVEASAEHALALSKSGRIGIIGTQGTIASAAYERALKKARPEVQSFARPCPLFVPLAEEGWTSHDDPVPLSVATRYLSPFADEGIDTLILGCTHYPLLKDVIQKVMGPDVALASAGAPIAERLSQLTSPGEKTARGDHRYYVTDLPRGFQTVAERFLGASLPALEQVDIV